MSSPNLPMTILYDQETIARRVKELGDAITKDLRGEPVVVVGILKGAFVFVADLVRAIKTPVTIGFMGVSSYSGTQSTGKIKITQDLSIDIKGKNVLFVEDIIDTGRTIDFLLDELAKRSPKTLKVCTFLSKPDAHEMHHTIDYVGKEITNEFVVGYGMDYNEHYRELPHIAQVQS